MIYIYNSVTKEILTLLFLYILVFIISYIIKKCYMHFNKIWIFVAYILYSVIASLLLFISIAIALTFLPRFPVSPLIWQYPNAIKQVQELYKYEIDLSYFPDKIPANAKKYKAEFDEGMLMASPSYQVKFDIDMEYIEQVKRLYRSSEKTEYYNGPDYIPKEYELYILPTSEDYYECGFAVYKNTIWFFFEDIRY